MNPEFVYRTDVQQFKKTDSCLWHQLKLPFPAFHNTMTRRFQKIARKTRITTIVLHSMLNS